MITPTQKTSQSIQFIGILADFALNLWEHFASHTYCVGAVCNGLKFFFFLMKVMDFSFFFTFLEVDKAPDASEFEQNDGRIDSSEFEQNDGRIDASELLK